MSRIGVVFAILTMLPSMAFAHATPVEMSPDSGENVEMAHEISIRFSERLEQGSSRIKVNSESGAIVSEDAIVGEDPYVLSAQVDAMSKGVYTVSWSVVSQDDGHFTKGAYAFAVGSSTVANVSESSVVKLTSFKETNAIFVEFIGNSILWGVLVLLVVAIRPIHAALLDSERRIRITLSILVAFGVILGIVGAAWQIFIKGSELASLHSIAFSEGANLYLHTAAGEATLYRMAAITGFGILFVFFRSRLWTGMVSWRDAFLVLALLTFAYFRATISHATANPFFPEMSIFVNLVHLIDKDLWFGILIVLVTFLVFSLQDVVRAIIPRAFSILALNLALISLTASYIVWLHLRDFHNLTTTEWGEHFLKLGTAAVFLAIFRTYHVMSLRWKPQFFSRWASFTLSAEMIVAGLVVFFSSLVIITSPPAHGAETRVFTHAEKGFAIELRQSPVEDHEALLSIKGEHALPIVRIGEGEGALLVSLTERFKGGYVLPLALLKGKDTSVEVIAQRSDGYDAHAVFAVSRNDFQARTGHGRTFDLFTMIIIIIALASCAFGLVLELAGKHSSSPDRLRASISSISGGIVAALVLAYFGVSGVSTVFANDFKALCAADGNMWHMMQPMKAGQSTSKTPREGCMLSSGTYHIADVREYEYLRSLGPADVSLTTTPERPVPGQKTSLAIQLTEADGSPAKLSIEHDKILHMIIIGADMTYFAHIHADDERALTHEEINGSAFAINHVFPKAGEYVIALDYLHGLVHESRQFRIVVGETKSPVVATYPSPGTFGGYDVDFRYIAPLAGDVATLQYTIRKDGVPVENLVPYLSAAMHVAVVKNDLSEFIHTHGEVHPPGYIPPTSLKGHNHAPPPAWFGPIVEAHLIFPSAGTYTVFGEFKDTKGDIIPTSFTVQVE